MCFYVLLRRVTRRHQKTLFYYNMKRKIMFPLLAAGVVALASCGGAQQEESTKVPAITLSNLDQTVAPSADFYDYACGGWMKQNPIGPEFARYGVFERLAETTQEQLKTVIEELGATTHEQGSVAQKVGTLYAMGMDSAKLNSDGFSPIVDELMALNGVSDKASLTKMVANLQKEGVRPFFSMFVSADEKNSTMNIISLRQSGTGMGDKDYYLQQDDNTVKVREAYKTYVKTLFNLLGMGPELGNAGLEAVMKIETALAEISYSRMEMRDSQKNYNKMSYADFKKICDAFDWDVYFAEMGLTDVKELDPKTLNYFKKLGGVLAKTTLDEQKYYLSFQLLNAASSYLSDAFVTANFEFFGKTMMGTQVQEPRWKRSINTVNRALGQAVGQMYVEKYFPASSKEWMVNMVANLQQALGERIDGLVWMSDATKAKAREKLSSFTVKIGYPDEWKDYSGLDIKEDSYWANIRRASIFDTEYNLSQAGKPVDRTRWFMTPQTVNAYYNPTSNEICFPAGILQPPFFNPDADDAVNYGAIGVVIGHEMTHGFDDEGRHYDAVGNMTDWWTPEDAAKFEERAEKLAHQYDQIIVIDTLHANGHYTLGENIADHGGLLVSHLAYMNSLKGKEVPAPIDGLTNEQRFYIGYATLWAQQVRPEEIRRRTKSDPHSLGRWRVNAALRNIDTFYEAFGIKEGDKMYMAPEDRVEIW